MKFKIHKSECRSLEGFDGHRAPLRIVVGTYEYLLLDLDALRRRREDDELFLMRNQKNRREETRRKSIPHKHNSTTGVIS